MMKQGGGVACCPKLSLHPNMSEEGGFAFELEPYSFYNCWYTSYDVVMANSYHLAWWASFGSRPLQSDVQDDTTKTTLARSMEELSDTLKDSFGLPIPECKCL
jgi:hypothetical protein